MTDAAHQDSGPDPYQLSADAVMEPPKRFGDMLRQVGPGLILTASIVGTGELIATTNLGAKAGFVLLWLVLLSCFIKVFVQIELGRYAISSGDTTLASFYRVPKMGGVLTWWWFMMTLCTQFQIGAMIGGVGQCVHMITPAVSESIIERFASSSPDLAKYLRANPGVPWSLVITPITIVLLVRGRYHVVERWSTVLVGLFTLLTVVCMLMLPWANLNMETSRQTVSMIGLMASPGVGPMLGTTTIAPPPVEASSIWIAAFAMIGITGVGASELVAYPYWCLEKRYARYIGPRDDTETWANRAKGWLKVMHTDAWLSMIIYTLATLAFFILGASILHGYTEGRGLSGSAGVMLKELAKMYEPVLGFRGSIWFIAIGGFIVLYSTLFAATAGNSRALTDFLRVQQLIPFNPPEYRVRWIRFFSGALPVTGLVLFLFVGNPVMMVVFGGVAQALTLPMIAAVAIFLRLKRTDRRLVKIGVWDVLLWVSLVMFALAAGYGVWSQIEKFIK